jgi:hypothetical protein
VYTNDHYHVEQAITDCCAKHAMHLAVVVHVVATCCSFTTQWQHVAALQLSSYMFFCEVKYAAPLLNTVSTAWVMMSGLQTDCSWHLQTVATSKVSL